MTDTMQVIDDETLETARETAGEALGRAQYLREEGRHEEAAELAEEAADALLNVTNHEAATGFRQADGTVNVPLFREEARAD